MSSTATLDAYLGSMFVNSMLTFQGSGKKLWEIYNEVKNDSLTDTSSLKHDEIKKGSIALLNKKAIFEGTGTFADPDVTLSNSYTVTTVDNASTELHDYTLEDGSSLEIIEPYTPKTGELATYIADLCAALQEAAAALDKIKDAVDIRFTENIDTFYTALWSSGFITLLQNYSAPSFIHDSVDTAMTHAITTATDAVMSRLNKKGFGVPSGLVTAARTEIAVVGGFSHADNKRMLDVATQNFIQNCYSNGLSAEQLLAGFTKMVNNMEVEYDKMRFAGVMAEAKASLSLLKDGVSAIAQGLSVYLEAADIAMQYLSLENDKINATQELSNAYGYWTKAVVAKQDFVKTNNSIHFAETANNLELAEATDALNRMTAELAITKTVLQAEKDMLSKELEVTINETETAKAAALVQQAAGYMTRADAELRAYIAAFTAEYEKDKSKVDSLAAINDMGVYAGQIMGNIVGESRVSIKKGTS